MIKIGQMVRGQCQHLSTDSLDQISVKFYKYGYFFRFKPSKFVAKSKFLELILLFKRKFITNNYQNQSWESFDLNINALSDELFFREKSKPLISNNPYSII